MNISADNLLDSEQTSRYNLSVNDAHVHHGPASHEILILIAYASNMHAQLYRVKSGNVGHRVNSACICKQWDSR